MKRGIAVLICTCLLSTQLQAIEWSPKQRWAMRIIGVGLVGVGFVARNNESLNNQRADGTISQFNASHPNKAAQGYLNDQFNAVAQQSEYQRSANAWSIAKNASWGTAGLLFTMSFIPNTWTRPAENGTGVMVGYDLKVGGKTKKK